VPGGVLFALELTAFELKAAAPQVVFLVGELLAELRLEPGLSQPIG